MLARRRTPNGPGSDEPRPCRFFQVLRITIAADRGRRVSFTGGLRAVEAIVSGWANQFHRRQGRAMWQEECAEKGDFWRIYLIEGARLTREDICDLTRSLMPGVTSYACVQGENEHDYWRFTLETHQHDTWETVRDGKEDESL